MPAASWGVLTQGRGAPAALPNRTCVTPLPARLPSPPWAAGKQIQAVATVGAWAFRPGLLTHFTASNSPRQHMARSDVR